MMVRTRCLLPFVLREKWWGKNKKWCSIAPFLIWRCMSPFHNNMSRAVECLQLDISDTAHVDEVQG
jgi:hypothetical protein